MRDSFQATLAFLIAAACLQCHDYAFGSVGGRDSSCEKELLAIKRLQPVVAQALDSEALLRVERAAVAHGRGVLLWYADLQNQWIGVGKRNDISRQFLAGSSKYLRCRYMKLANLPEWRSEPDSTVPSDWAVLGQVLMSETGCAVFLRSESTGVGYLSTYADYPVGWSWSGKCPKGVAGGVGIARQTLLSGETSLGLANNGFETSPIEFGLLHGLVQITDSSRPDTEWHNLFDRYERGRVVERVRRSSDGKLTAVVFRKRGEKWSWVESK